MIEGGFWLISVLPLAGAFLLGMALLVGLRPAERYVRTMATFLSITGVVIALGLAAQLYDVKELHYPWGDWFARGEAHFRIEFYLDRFAAALLVTASTIGAVVAQFSHRYLHRDSGFYRFYVLFLTFLGAVSLVLTSGNIDTLFIGWELVGVSSVLLIGFFQFRDGPVRGSFFALVCYRVGDIAFIVAIALLHRWARGRGVEISFVELSGLATDEELLGIASLLAVAAFAKSAQLPFSPWMVRAMEGPTPSSAVFYGAVAAHLGAYLFLRTAPLWRSVPGLSKVNLFVAVSTAVYAAWVGRTRSDAKSQLAFATVSQLGLIFSELSLGWDNLAVVHMVGHSFLRTLQFLRAPSLLHQFHLLGALGHPVPAPRESGERVYRWALWEGFVPHFLRASSAFFSSIFLACERFETRWREGL